MIFPVLRSLVPLRCICLFLILCISERSTVTAKKVLLLGDSNSKLMGQYMEVMCTGAEVTNAGIGGTTAAQWQYYTSEYILHCPESGPWDAVYISVGANDFSSSNCTMSEEELTKVVESAVENIVRNIAPGAETYFMTGYCFPPESGGDRPSGCDSVSSMFVADAIQSIEPVLPDGTDLRIIDSTFMCGANETSFSDPAYFLPDGAHLNSRGYCTVFSQPEIFDDILECTNNAVDLQCETAPVIGFNSMGIEHNCADWWLQRCKDSELDFKVNGITRNCAWVQQSATELKCGPVYGRLATHCPLTCGSCYVDACTDAVQKFTLPDGDIKSCSWVGETDTEGRCSIGGVRDTCRDTCFNLMCFASIWT